MDVIPTKAKTTLVPRRGGGITTPTVLIRSTAEWADYLDRLCLAECRSRPNLVETAVRDWALSHGYPVPPPRI